MARGAGRAVAGPDDMLAVFAVAGDADAGLQAGGAARIPASRPRTTPLGGVLCSAVALRPSPLLYRGHDGFLAPVRRCSPRNSSAGPALTGATAVLLARCMPALPFSSGVVLHQRLFLLSA